MKKFLFWSFLSVFLLAALVLSGVWLHFYLSDRALDQALEAAPHPESFLSEQADRLLSREAETEDGKKLYEALRACTDCRFNDDFSYEKETLSAWQSISVTSVDLDALRALTLELLNRALAQKVEDAVLSTEVYTEELTIREDVFSALFEDALDQALSSLSEMQLSQTRRLDFSFTENNVPPDQEKSFFYRLSRLFPRRLDASWSLNGQAAFDKFLFSLLPEDMDAYASSLRESVSSQAAYVRKLYSISQAALSGPKPNPALFGSTTDPAEIEALLQHPYAKQLIGDAETVWNSQLSLNPRWPELEYYLDESILVLNWKEERNKAAYTFSEVFIADGSQLRRRIAGDAFEDKHHETPLSFAEKTNGVLTFTGDMYHHGRRCGIMVYQGEIYRFEPKKTDTCFITEDGDMLFAYRGQMETEEQAKAFIEENNILFSLVFGPVLVDEGVDVTPTSYTWGEIRDDYNRSILGMIGRHHYLTMNCNNYDAFNFHVCTLREAADIMIEKGCWKAYTLDGGQSTLTVLMDHYVNPSQKKYQRTVSDVVYFATAVPDLWVEEAEEDLPS